MHPAVQTLLIIAAVILLVILFPALLIIALLLLLLWLIMNLATHGPVWISWQRDAALLRMGKFPWFRRLPGITPTLRRVEQRKSEREAERERQAEDTRRKKAEAEARERAERDRAYHAAEREPLFGLAQCAGAGLEKGAGNFAAYGREPYTHRL